MKDTLILAIESSCDETAASVVKNGRTILSNVISSQIALHTLYGGVVPEIASRKHIEKINQVIEQALADADVTLDDLDAIGVTYGPGLVGALLVGVAEAKAIAYAKKLPLVGVHHIEGHVSANYIEHPDLEPPFLCLIVSGGHTHLVIVKDYGEFEILGRTRDDAAGEAFDKVARAIGLGYPGGPKVDKLSKEGNPNAIEFPKAKIGDCPYDFSFSGVKSAVLNYINHAQMTGEEINRADLAASFQKAVVDVLVEHTMLAAKDYGMTKIAIAGGVASNGTLRAAMEEACKKNNYSFYRPSPIFCTDNAAGQGKRMHSKVQKQFLEIQGYPVLYYSLRCFQESPLIQDIILVTGEESISYCKEEIVQKYGFTKVSAVIPGGKERYDSVYAGLCECRDCEYVLIHDGARPFVTEEILKRGLQKVKETGACVIGMPSKDTVKLSDEEGYVKETPNRKCVWTIQTPQIFSYSLIREAHDSIRQKDMSKITDDAMVVEQETGAKVALAEGSYQNIKITTPEDLDIAEAFLKH